MALTDNLISYWKLDEASGTRADAHGSNTLADNNTVLAATGIINDGADFESGTAESLSITDATQTGLDISPDMSISLWAKAETLPTSGNWMTFVNKDNESTQFQYSFAMFNNGGTQQIRFFAFQTLTATIYSFAQWTHSVSTTGFDHLVVVFDGSAATGSGKFTLYANGTSLGDGAGFDTGGGATSIANGTSPFELGRNTGDAARYYDGILDEVGIWNRTLSEAEVIELYNSGAALAYPFAPEVISWNIALI